MPTSTPPRFRFWADLTTRDYPMGHGVSPDELRDSRAWLQGDPAGAA